MSSISRFDQKTLPFFEYGNQDRSVSTNHDNIQMRNPVVFFTVWCNWELSSSVLKAAKQLLSPLTCLTAVLHSHTLILLMSLALAVLLITLSSRVTKRCVLCRLRPCRSDAFSFGLFSWVCYRCFFSRELLCHFVVRSLCKSWRYICLFQYQCFLGPHKEPCYFIFH